MKNKVLNIVIIVLVVGCLILGGKIGYDYYMGECEQYNDNIVNFTIEMIKGNKSLEDVDSLDATDEVKESLRQYYNDTFYSDDDLILIYEDVAFFYSNREKLKKIQQSYGEELKSLECSYYYSYGIVSPDASEDEIKFANLATSYIYLNEKEKNTDGIIEEHNNLYIKLKDLDFKNLDSIYVFYNGLKININKYGLNKVSIVERQKDNNYRTIAKKNEYSENKDKIIILKNEPKEYRIIVTLNLKISFGKIKNIEIQEQF